jgi:hypothetical protein
MKNYQIKICYYKKSMNYKKSLKNNVNFDYTIFKINRGSYQ